MLPGTLQVNRVELSFADVGISIKQVSEAKLSSECPECESDNMSRNGDSFRCYDCKLDAHSDIAAVVEICALNAYGVSFPVV
ncbi:zinc ribbon domain-containing protein [Natronococcus wangiae]|uniref:zinc ribbon domain-containing protein n=1 Tax=Natronococcus wangiae TaxID=3068275 RepID=UPI00273F31F1|nr:zinc ribbon domain-containing protein [Natronococcus sp. AD5]